MVMVVSLCMTYLLSAPLLQPCENIVAKRRRIELRRSRFDSCLETLASVEELLPESDASTVLRFELVYDVLGEAEWRRNELGVARVHARGALIPTPRLRKMSLMTRECS